MPAPLWASNIGGSSPRYGVDDEDDGTAFRTQSMSRVARHDCQLMRLQGDRTANFDVEKSRPFEAAEQLIAVGMGMEIRSLVRDDAEADIQSIDTVLVAKAVAIQAMVLLAESGWSALVVASQPLDVTHRRLTKEPLVLTAELRGIVVADPVASGRGVELAGDE